MFGPKRDGTIMYQRIIGALAPHVGAAKVLAGASMASVRANQEYPIGIGDERIQNALNY
jgi:hypothetical protein